MATKEFGLGEDTDLSKGEPPLKPNEAAPKDPNPQIKNAHASGDGSFGRNDESLPEEGEVKGEDKVKDDDSY